MRIILCLEWEGVDCDSEQADEIVDLITSACAEIKTDFGATHVWVDDANNSDANTEQEQADDGWYMVQRYYGADHGWDQYYHDSNDLFDTPQSALQQYWEVELEEGADLADLVLPEDIRIIRFSNVV